MRGAAAIAGLLLVSSCGGVNDASEPAPKDAGVDVVADAAGLVDGSWLCTPKTCSALDADCGDTSDGCGNVISCGTCSNGETCGAGGPNRCGVGACTPTTCAAASAECGLVGDGCGKTLDCGTCTLPKTCGAGGEVNKCNCVPTTCTAAGATCGSVPDGCGTNLDCGSCKAPKTCGGLGTPNVCGCSPSDCPPIYANSFESTADFPTGWNSWQNCATDTTWSAARDQFPAPSGGSFDLRLHTTGFVSPPCQYPGIYALTPGIAATAGRDYRVEAWIRNGGNSGVTTILFYDGADQEIGNQEIVWAPDTWQYGADPSLIAKSPANTQKLRLRFGLQTASAFADVDRVEVYLEPL